MPHISILRELFPKASAANKVAFNVEGFSITSTEQLLFAEEVLDAMDAELVQRTLYADLHAKADQYVREHLELLQKPWLRTAGAVHDILEALRQEKGIKLAPPGLH